MTITAKDRILAKVTVDPVTGCWVWTGSKDINGYARVSFAGRNCKAARVAWAVFNDRPWPEASHALHSCDNRPCVNPAHIRPGTHSENIQEAWDRGALKGRRQHFKTRCDHGHELTPDNLVANRGRGSAMFCRTCARQSYARNNAKRRAVS